MQHAITTISRLNLSASIHRSKLILPRGFVDLTNCTRLLCDDMARVRKCAGASIADSEPAQWNQPRPKDDFWDQLYETVTSRCENNWFPRAEAYPTSPENTLLTCINRSCREIISCISYSDVRLVLLVQTSNHRLSDKQLWPSLFRKTKIISHIRELFFENFNEYVWFWIRKNSMPSKHLKNSKRDSFSKILSFGFL